jgi:hypothetical protein
MQQDAQIQNGKYYIALFLLGCCFFIHCGSVTVEVLHLDRVCILLETLRACYYLIRRTVFEETAAVPFEFHVKYEYTLHCTNLHHICTGQTIYSVDSYQQNPSKFITKIS